MAIVQCLGFLEVKIALVWSNRVSPNALESLDQQCTTVQHSSILSIRQWEGTMSLGRKQSCLLRTVVWCSTAQAQTRIAAHSHQADCTTLVAFIVLVLCSTLRVNIIVHWMVCYVRLVAW